MTGKQELRIKESASGMLISCIGVRWLQPDKPAGSNCPEVVPCPVSSTVESKRGNLIYIKTGNSGLTILVSVNSPLTSLTGRILNEQKTDVSQGVM